MKQRGMFVALRLRRGRDEKHGRAPVGRHLRAIPEVPWYVVPIDPPWLYANGRALARSGRPVLRLDEQPSMRTHAISAAIFATYPLWLWLGYLHRKR